MVKMKNISNGYKPVRNQRWGMELWEVSEVNSAKLESIAVRTARTPAARNIQCMYVIAQQTMIQSEQLAEDIGMMMI